MFSVKGDRSPLQYHPCIRAIGVVLLFYFLSFALAADRTFFNNYIMLDRTFQSLH
ncbi:MULTISPECIES: hypothetical protein [unclassified Microcoleus]|uniref:hypothetical protein n=1 Tax=unclassified Microcoleus TaxID=2642155 RepID=UPI002FCEE5C3